MFNQKIERDGLSILCKDVRHLMENKEYNICQERIGMIHGQPVIFMDIFCSVVAHCSKTATVRTWENLI